MRSWVAPPEIKALIILVDRKPLRLIADRLKALDEGVVSFDRGLNGNVVGLFEADGLQ